MEQLPLVNQETGEVIQMMTKAEAEAATSVMRDTAFDLEKQLLDFYERDGWKAMGYRSMNKYLLNEFPEYSKGQLYRKLQAARTRQNIKEVPLGTSLPERVVRPIATNEYIARPEIQQEIIKDAIGHTDNGKPTAKDVEEAKRRYVAKKEHKPKKESRPVFNRTNENIEWAAWSWNPITGCLHNCDYCYARDIANRFYDEGFEPTFRPERLAAPENTSVPKPRWNGDIGNKGVFVCSMADLFGKWVPREWIDATLEVIRNSPQWTYLLLSKFPIRMAEFDYPPNVWLGTTVDRQYAVDRAEKAFTAIQNSGFSGVCWLSCEPMLERLTFSSLEMFDWVAIGGASKSSRTPEYLPPFDDIVHLHNQARLAGILIYQKTNLIPGMSDSQRLREYPGEF